MDKYQTEIFGEFTYAESLTYEELLEIENDLIALVDGVFQDGGAEHLDFTPHGDILMFQCAFECRDLEILRDIATELASSLSRGVRGRILCLEKDLASFHLFWVAREEWKEKAFPLPAQGPADARAHIVKASEENRPGW